jgi:hypothetical protein
LVETNRLVKEARGKEEAGLGLISVQLEKEETSLERVDMIITVKKDKEIKQGHFRLNCTISMLFFFPHGVLKCRSGTKVTFDFVLRYKCTE